MKDKKRVVMTLNKDENLQMDFLKEKLGFKQASVTFKWILKEKYFNLKRQEKENMSILNI